MGDGVGTREGFINPLAVDDCSRPRSKLGSPTKLYLSTEPRNGATNGAGHNLRTPNQYVRFGKFRRITKERFLGLLWRLPVEGG